MSTRKANFDAPRCVILNRVSTEVQTDNYSLSSQDQENRAYAARIGGVVVASFNEVISGALYFSRLELQKAIALIEDNHADTLITFDLSRFSRHSGYQQLMLDRLSRAGGRLMVTTLPLEYNEDNELTPESELNAGMQGQFNQYHRKKIRADTTRGRRKAAREGRQPAPAFAPTGYRVWRRIDVLRGNVPPEKLGKYEIVEPDIELPKQIFAWLLEGKSACSLLRHFHANGVHAPRGGVRWNVSTIKNMIENTVYMGKARYGRLKNIHDENRQKSGFKQAFVRRPRPENEIIYVPCPAIVSPEEWQRANENFHGNKQKRTGNPRKRATLQGLLRCAKCGCCMAYRSRGERKKKYYRTDGSPVWRIGKPYAVYECNDSRMSRTKGAPVCTSTRYQSHYVEPLVVNAILQLAQHPKIIASQLDSTRQFNEYSKDDKRREETQMRKRLSDMERRAAAIADAHIEAVGNGLDASIYLTKAHELNTQIEQLRGALLAFDQVEQRLVQTATRAAQIAQTIEHSRALLVETTTGDELNRVLSQFIARITPDKNGNFDIVFKS